MAVGAGARDPVHELQAFADRPDPARGRALEVARCDRAFSHRHPIVSQACRGGAQRRRQRLARIAASTSSATIVRDRGQQRPGERVAGADRDADRHRL